MEQALKIAQGRVEAGEWRSPVARGPRFDEDDEVSDISLQGMEEVEMQTGPDAKLDLQRNHFQAEQFVGGISSSHMPSPLTASQRETLIRSLQPTATFDMLRKIPSDVLCHPGREGEELRRRLLSGATVVFFSAGYAGKRFTFEIAAKLGVKAVVIDNPDSWAKDLVDQGLIAKFIGIDMGLDTEKVFDIAYEAIKNLENDPLTGPADGICTFVELSVPLASRLAEALGLPGPSPAAVDNARDKHRSRKCVQDAGLPSIRNVLVDCESKLDSAAAEVGFPAVIKPVSGAASLGVKKVNSADELNDIYHETVTLMTSLVVSAGALERATEVEGKSTGGVEASSVINTALMLEEYLDGQEVDCDIILSRGECTYAQVSDNGPTREPYFLETWGSLPSRLSPEKVEELETFMIACVKSMGFEDGVFHVEGKYTSRGPRLIEVNARMGGGPVWTVHKQRFGIDLVAETISLAVGIPSIPHFDKNSPTCIGYALVNAQNSGVVGGVDFLDSFKHRPGVILCRPCVKKGERVVGPEEGQPTWLADIIVKAWSAEEAVSMAKEFENEIAQTFSKQYV